MLRCLVADDDETVRQFFQECLTDAGHSCRAVADGDECWKALHEGAYDVLFLDLIMPGLPAAEILHEVHVHFVRTKVVIISVADDLGVVEEQIRAGAVSYLTKPFAYDQVLGVLRNIERTRPPA